MAQEKKNNGKNIPAMIIRGGTSKGVYLLKSDLPEECEKWDAILLKMMGSPDKKQIDGLGGSQSVTSKVAIVNKSERADADVDYTFAQVSVDKPIVSYKGNCGNISSGVGPFAIEKGLIDTKEGTTPVRIYNTNTDKIIVADVKTKNGEVVYEGDFGIAGVPGTASPIRLKFMDPAGTLGKGLLPTGHAVDVLEVPGFGTVEVSIIDAANPLVFARAKDLGLTGKELPDELKKIIEEKKQKEMKLTYMSGDKLYIVRGYGVQKTGGYSIQVKDLYQAKNAVYFKSELIGPGENDVSEKVESYPYIVVSTEKTEDIVVFE